MQRFASVILGLAITSPAITLSWIPLGEPVPNMYLTSRAMNRRCYFDVLHARRLSCSSLIRGGHLRHLRQLALCAQGVVPPPRALMPITSMMDYFFLLLGSACVLPGLYNVQW